ncbi:hypothetical protein [Fusibacter tunisiensis]|uniref:Uncharacterized protein n=1 Tax=Fusibacter tunisiensis TaxID=1008308 RepID=A0ABS2MP48_9FIRM|nr:hypothetical protein [Fusibacter tunisiensis]MBM7561162.1 hypothetical protein [Fusibacter tunisiensis]
MEKINRKKIYDFAYEIKTNSNPNSIINYKDLGEDDLLELLYKSFAGNEMATLLLAEHVIDYETHSNEIQLPYEKLRLLFT